MRDTIDMARQSHLDVYGLGKDHAKFVDAIKAFEALVRVDERNSWPAEMEAMERQVNILTDALAAQPAPVQPVASYKGPEELWLQLHGDCSDDELTEPVDYTDDSVTWCWHQIYDSDVRYVREDTAAQRQWVGLSDLNIDELENEYMKSAQTAHQFLRAIEAKLKEKNT
jgi:hypothetical protein